MSRARKMMWGLPLIAAAVFSAAGAAPANAAPLVSSDGDFCAVWAPTGKMACVANQKDYALAKQAALGSSVLAASSSDSATAAAGPYAWVTVFDNINQDTSAGYLTFFGPNDCTTSRTNLDGAWNDTTTWRNRISSFDALSNCYAKPYAGVNRTGTTLSSYYGAKDYLDVLNDHVWSLGFS